MIINNVSNNTSFKASLVASGPNAALMADAIEPMRQIFQAIPKSEGDTVVFTLRKLGNRVLGNLEYCEKGVKRSNPDNNRFISVELETLRDSLRSEQALSIAKNTMITSAEILAGRVKYNI